MTIKFVGDYEIEGFAWRLFLSLGSEIAKQTRIWLGIAA